jgi:hypothetical protein
MYLPFHLTTMLEVIIMKVLSYIPFIQGFYAT